MTSPTTSKTTDLYTFKVEGDTFKFSRSSLHATGVNALSTRIKQCWNSKGPFHLEADRKIFRKWIAPFIRDRLLPDKGSINDQQELNMIIATADRLGLKAILEHFRPKTIQAQPSFKSLFSNKLNKKNFNHHFINYNR